ncbi:PQQ-binding-like beta-propeller repeat protein [Cellulophaga lytica]|uniref:PQQ-binding-like beta-propeller repeat protein n=1 Tax=Cellulophaga lytica TaxID=979 RepID=UPI0026E22089|nr:PQQ-binding-like beta-propeller repeat protein [Cellulophaga lytica]MDO6853966.1 PQQ-binding-like beta-propeller repeat protein [Cellulophaga lytica]
MFKKNDELNMLSIETNKYLWEQKINTQHLLFDYDKYIYPYSNYKILEKRSKKTGKILGELKGNLYPIVKQDFFVWVEREFQNEYFLSQINLEDFTIINFCKIGNKRITSILNNNFVCRTENILTSHNIENAEELWKLDVSKLGEYLDLKGTEHEELRVGTVHELYTYNAILVALLRNDTIIGIDSATGDVLWQKPLFLFISRPVQLNDKLYHIITGVDVKNMLQVYDLATGKLEREVEIIHPVLKENTFFTKRFINDTYIALTATKTGEILVINHKTAIIEDYAKLPNLKEKIPIDNIPQVHQNKVYQLDGEGTLYIFEKEEKISFTKV